MPQWKYSVHVHGVIQHGETVEDMQATYDGLNRVLAHIPVALPERWHHYAKLGIEQEDVVIFNLGMAALYDWADEHRVWLDSFEKPLPSGEATKVSHA